jgi:hypothetical protein
LVDELPDEYKNLPICTFSEHPTFFNDPTNEYKMSNALVSKVLVRKKGEDYFTQIGYMISSGPEKLIGNDCDDAMVYNFCRSLFND